VIEMHSKERESRGARRAAHCWVTAIVACFATASAHAQEYGPPYSFIHQGGSDIQEVEQLQIDQAMADGTVRVQSMSLSAGGDFATWAHVAHNVIIQPNAVRVEISAQPFFNWFGAEAWNEAQRSYSAAEVSLQLVVWDNQDVIPGDVFREIAHPVNVLRHSWVPAVPYQYDGDNAFDVTRSIATTLSRVETRNTEQWHVAVALQSWARSALGMAVSGGEMSVPAIIVRQFDRSGREL